MGCPIFNIDTYILPPDEDPNSPPECYTPRCDLIADLTCCNCYLEYCAPCILGFRNSSAYYEYFYRNQDNFFCVPCFIILLSLT
jgi:hypothetical protein